MFEEYFNMLPPGIGKIIKTFYNLMGNAREGKWYNTQKALSAATELHRGKNRAGGEPYIIHPLQVCTYIITHFTDRFEKVEGLNKDYLLAAALLHDVVEDVPEIRNNPQKLVTEYGIDPEVVKIVIILSKQKGISDEVYYTGIRTRVECIIIKIADRANNIETMEPFDIERKRKYIGETFEYVIPLCKYAKRHYPEFGNPISSIRSHIESICRITEKSLDREEKMQSELEEVLEREKALMLRIEELEGNKRVS